MTSLKLIADIKIIEANLEFGEKTEIQDKGRRFSCFPNSINVNIINFFSMDDRLH